MFSRIKIIETSKTAHMELLRLFLQFGSQVQEIDNEVIMLRPFFFLLLWSKLSLFFAPLHAMDDREKSTLDLSQKNLKSSQVTPLLHDLKYNNTITTLLLWGNYLDDDAALELAQTLEVNTQLTKVWISNNDITDKGALALCKALEKNTQLLDLNLSFNKITSQGANCFINLLNSGTNKTIKILNLAANMLPESTVIELNRLASSDRSAF